MLSTSRLVSIDVPIIAHISDSELKRKEKELLLYLITELWLLLLYLDLYMINDVPPGEDSIERH